MSHSFFSYLMVTKAITLFVMVAPESPAPTTVPGQQQSSATASWVNKCLVYSLLIIIMHDDDDEVYEVCMEKAQPLLL